MHNQFPIIAVDNFYDDPYKVRDFALSLEYEKPTGNYPGVRTRTLDYIQPKFFNSFCQRLFSLYYYYEPNPDVVWNVGTFFQKTHQYDEDPTSILNTGWIHADDSPAMLAGIIYLNPNPRPDAGTSFYKLKHDVYETSNLNYDLRNDFYNDRDVDLEEYKKELTKVNESYTKTLEVKNVFNRLALYGADIHHKENGFVATETEPRLTQLLFVNNIKSSIQQPPIPRMREHGIEF